MIKNKELKQGNFIHFDKVKSQVTGIYTDIPGITHKILFEGFYRYINIESERALGINLSSDVLREFGFERKFNYYKRVEKWASVDSKVVFYFDGHQAALDSSFHITKTCLYLHHLQNEYYEITSLELTSRIIEKPAGNMLSIIKRLLIYGNVWQQRNVRDPGIFKLGVSLVYKQLLAVLLSIRNMLQPAPTNGEMQRPKRQTS